MGYVLRGFKKKPTGIDILESLPITEQTRCFLASKEEGFNE